MQNPYVAGQYYDVRKVDTLIYFATIRGLEIWKWKGSESEVVSRFSTEGLAYGIDICGDYVYVADFHKGLCIVDVSNPWSPKPTSIYETGGKTCDVCVCGSTAYLADQEKGFLIIDVANPGKPSLVGKCAGIGKAFSVTVNDTLAYLGTLDGPMKVVNMANPSMPFSVGALPVGTPRTYCIDALLDDTLAYVNCLFSPQGSIITFAIVNVSDPTNPIVASGLSLPMTNRGIAKSGNYIYTNTQHAGTYIIDVADPSVPFVEGLLDDKSMPGYGCVVDQNQLFVPHYREGFSIVDVRNRHKPLPLSYHENVDWKYFCFEANHGYMCIVGHITEDRYAKHSILNIVDITDPSNLNTLGKLRLQGRCSVYEGSVDSQYMAVTVHRGHPRSESVYTAIIDVTDPYEPRLCRFERGGGVHELHFPYLYALEGNKLRIADVNSFAFWIDSISLDHEGYDLVIVGSLAYITVADSFIILDLATKSLVSSCYHGRPYAVNISLDFPYVAVPYTPFGGSTYGFLLFDVGDPCNSELVFDTLIQAPPVHPSISIMGCELEDTLLFIGRGNYGFDIWVVEFPNTIHRVVSQETPSLATHCYPSGNSNIHFGQSAIFLIDGGSLEVYILAERQDQ